MANQVITDYLGQGLLASRPVAPDLVTGAAAFYFATDTETLYVWNGSEWKEASGGGGAAIPVIVQRKIGAVGDPSSGLTLDSPPTEGNLLVAFVVNGSTPPVAGSGWTRSFSNTAAPDAAVMLKAAGDSESTLQTPTSTSNPGVLAIYEVSGAAWAVETSGNTTTSSSTSQTLNIPEDVPILRPTLILGAFSRMDATLPVSVTGATPDLDVADGLIGVHMQTWYINAAVDTTHTVTASYVGTGASRRMYASIV